MGRTSSDPADLRQEAVRLVLHTDKTAAEVARDLGVNPKTLGNLVLSEQAGYPSPGRWARARAVPCAVALRKTRDGPGAQQSARAVRPPEAEVVEAGVFMAPALAGKVRRSGRRRSRPGRSSHPGS